MKPLKKRKHRNNQVSRQAGFRMVDESKNEIGDTKMDKMLDLNKIDQ
jgi:hypothetical protein